MSSFMEEAKAAIEQRQQEEREAQEAKIKSEGRVETLDEIAELIYNVMKERILREIKEGRRQKETTVQSNGLFRPKTTISSEYVSTSAQLSLMDGVHLAAHNERTIYTNDDDEISSIRDRIHIRLTDRKQYPELTNILGRKLAADHISYRFSWIKAPDEKAEKRDKKRFDYSDGYIWAEVSLGCKYYTA